MKILFKIIVWVVNRNLRWEESRKWDDVYGGGYGWILMVYVYKKGQNPETEGCVFYGMKRWWCLRDYLKYAKPNKNVQTVGKSI